MWQKVAKFKGAEYFRKALYQRLRRLMDDVGIQNVFQLNPIPLLWAIPLPVHQILELTPVEI